MEQGMIFINIIFHVAYYYIIMLNLCIKSACLMVEVLPQKLSIPWNEQSIAKFTVLTMFPLLFI